jgi:hypothetical protein
MNLPELERKRGIVSMGNDETASRVHLRTLIDQKIIQARAFSAVARLRYDQGKIESGNQARLKALESYSEARRLVIRVAEKDRAQGLLDLEQLQANVMALLNAETRPFKERAELPDGQRDGGTSSSLFKGRGLRNVALFS